MFEEEANKDSESEIQSDFSEVEEEPSKRPQKTPKKTVQRTRWDEDEVAELKLYFGTHLASKICPRKYAIEVAKKQSKKRGGKLWRRTNDKIVKKISNINHK